MLKNNNQSAVKRISRRSLKENRSRNCFTILAVILTTFMFTVVFGIGFSMVQNMKTMYLRQQGTRASISLERPSKEQKEQAEQVKALYAAGIQIPAGEGTDLAGENSFWLLYYDEVEFQKNYLPAISDKQGSYPKKENEIMLSMAGLEKLGIKEPKMGMDIELRIDSKEKTFQLCGWFTDYSFSGLPCFVSQSYVDRLGLHQEETGVLSLSAKPGKQNALLKELERVVKLREGQEFRATYDIQEENRSVALATATAVILISLIILSSGYLLIYNVMYISVTKDIRFYGMLKTLGTTPSQIRAIVKRQVFYLSLIGISLGLLSGMLLSFAAVPYAMQMFATGTGQAAIMPTDISFNPYIYGGTVLFTLLTIAVSSRKPAKYAGKASPVEALKYNGQDPVKVRKKKGTSGGKIYKMAFRNVFREKKRAVLVFASLFMGTMAFLAVDTFLGSLKMENYARTYLPDDYTIYTNSGTEGDTVEAVAAYQEKIKTLIEELETLDGITSLSVTRSTDVDLRFDEKLFLPFLENKFSDEESLKEAIASYRNPENDDEAYAAPAIAVSTEMIERYNRTARQQVDLERFEKGEVCLIGSVREKSQSDTMLGKTITIESEETGKSMDLEIAACLLPSEDTGLNIGYYWQMDGAPDSILMSDAAIKQVCDEPDIDAVIINCDPKQESRITKAVKDLVKQNIAVIAVEIKSELLKEFQISTKAMEVLGTGISLVLILIGIINFINVMLTGVFARRGELAVMESVGMTKKQIRKMLGFEGIYYGGITLLLILTLGNAIIYLLADMASKIADYAVFYYPFGKMFVLAAIIMVICVIVPAVVYRSLSKESVTERLRKE